MKNNNLRVSVGIPTYEVSMSLVSTLNSVYKQSKFKSVAEIILLVDGSKINSKFLEKIINPKLKIIKLKKRQGQSNAISQILKISNGDLIVLTNDDVIWTQSTLENLIAAYQKTNSDLIAGCVRPLPPISFIEKIIQVGASNSHSIALSWRKGDNYLACNGRLLALTKRLAKEISIPKKIWNNDAFIYITAKHHKFAFTHVEKAICFFKSPSTLKEFFQQSIKFQHSKNDNQPHFRFDITPFYQIPLGNILFSFIQNLLKKPIETILHLVFLTFAKLRSRGYKAWIRKESFWETDKSTKLLPYAN